MSPESNTKYYTDTRIFLADEVYLTGDGYKLQSWYDIEDGKWRHHGGSITLTREAYPDIDVDPEVK